MGPVRPICRIMTAPLLVERLNPRPRHLWPLSISLSLFDLGVKLRGN